MSCDWNVHCVDCKDTHYFNDANHEDKLMAALCKHADAIAGLVDLVKTDDVQLGTLWGRVDPGWFARHRGHKLVPINEYGDLLTQCAEFVKCGCGSMRRCTKDAEHDGDHTAEERK